MPTANASNLAFRVRGNYLRSCMLLLLAEGPKHGYELMNELSGRGYGETDTGGLYRELRAMEEEGLIESFWEHGDHGPPRRVYTVTDEGRAWLEDSAVAVRDMRRRLTRFLRLYRDLGGETSARMS